MKTIKGCAGVLLLAFAVVALMTAAGQAQSMCLVEKPNAGLAAPRPDLPNLGTPASVLIYPYWTATTGAVTLITVTNTNCSYFQCVPGTGVAWGDVLLHFNYVDGENCSIFDQYEFLTPNDTLSVLAGEHALQDRFGWLYVVALDPESFEPIDFDWLIGDLIVGSGEDNYLWQCQAIPFHSFGDRWVGPRRGCFPVGGFPWSANGHPLADNDNDGLIDFNAYQALTVGPNPPEYPCFPNELYISHFNEPGAALRGDLVLFTTLAVEDPPNPVQVNFKFYNNDEFGVSAQIQFECMFIDQLKNITSFVENMPPNQNQSGPWDRFTTGWVRMEPVIANTWPQQGAPVMGAFFQLVAGTGFGAGTLLHMENSPVWDPTMGGRWVNNPTCTENRFSFMPFPGSLPY